MSNTFSIGAMLHPVPGELETRFADIRELGLTHVQIGYNPALDNAEGIAELKSVAENNGVEITTVFCGFAGEDYSSIPIVRATVGLVPTETRAERVKLVDSISKFALGLSVNRVAAHIGFIPEDAADPRYPDLVETVKGICDELAAREQVFALETGQETAKTLRRFIDDLERPNIRVNCDPANMILYGNDNPIEALDLLAPWIDGIHAKDGTWPTETDMLGAEVPWGQGDVNAPVWFAKLLAGGYRGPLTIEREISGAEQQADIRAAKALLESFIGEKAV